MHVRSPRRFTWLVAELGVEWVFYVPSGAKLTPTGLPRPPGRRCMVHLFPRTTGQPGPALGRYEIPQPSWAKGLSHLLIGLEAG